MKVITGLPNPCGGAESSFVTAADKILAYFAANRVHVREVVPWPNGWHLSGSPYILYQAHIGRTNINRASTHSIIRLCWQKIDFWLIININASSIEHLLICCLLISWWSIDVFIFYLLFTNFYLRRYVLSVHNHNHHQNQPTNWLIKNVSLFENVTFR